MTRPCITSTSNDLLKLLRRLRRKGRGMGGVLVEGHRPVRAALEFGAVVREVYAAPALFLGTAPESSSSGRPRFARLEETAGRTACSPSSTAH